MSRRPSPSRNSAASWTPANGGLAGVHFILSSHVQSAALSGGHRDTGAPVAVLHEDSPPEWSVYALIVIIPGVQTEMGTPSDHHRTETATEVEEKPGGLTATAFLNVAGHELRGPVTALKGQLQLMQRRIRREGSRERDDESLTKMLYQIERMQQLVAVYLDAAYSARGVLSLLRQSGNLVPMVERVVNLYAVASAKHPMTVAAAEPMLIGKFDTGRIDLVMRELLGNAVRYADEGPIDVRVWRDGDMAHVEVEDAGPMIAPDHAERIFESYVTDSKAQNTGLGLGLYISREVVRLHGGEMGWRCGDRGNVFWFTLPLDEEAKLGPVGGVSGASSLGQELFH